MDNYILSLFFGIITSFFTTYIFGQVINLKNILFTLIDVFILSLLGYLTISFSTELSVLFLSIIVLYLFFIKNYYYLISLKKQNTNLTAIVSELTSKNLIIYESSLPSIVNIIKIKNKIFISTSLIEKLESDKLSIVALIKINSKKNYITLVTFVLYVFALITFYLGAENSSNKYLFFIIGGVLIGIVKIISENYSQNHIRIHNLSGIVNKGNKEAFINALNEYIKLLQDYPNYKKEILKIENLIYEIKKS